MSDKTSNERTFRDLVSDLVACALIEGARPTSMTASVETKSAKQRVLDAFEAKHSETTRECGWFGEGRGKCLLKEGHRDEHTCEHDGRQLRKAMQGLAAVSEAERRAEKTTAKAPL